MTRTLAITRPVPASLARCELTHLARMPIDLARARAQHAAYERALEAAGCEIVRLAELPEQPDSVFVADPAVVLNEIAVIARPGAASRRGEVASVAAVLAPHRELAHIEPPGTLDGGDVLVLERTLYVGLSNRTNAEGARQLAALVAGHGHQVRRLEVEGALHLQTAVTQAAERVLVLNPRWLDASQLPDWDRVEIDAREPFAANVLYVHGVTLCAAAHPRTNEALAARGARVVPVEADELAKAEGGVTCCSLLVQQLGSGTDC
ncbi:MAG TPA: arginine deiminase family protein [Myxococcota bacterium]|nr:arginine deiminase family protein [Myxococcota bacterium]